MISQDYSAYWEEGVIQILDKSTVYAHRQLASISLELGLVLYGTCLAFTVPLYPVLQYLLYNILKYIRTANAKIRLWIIPVTTCTVRTVR